MKTAVLLLLTIILFGSCDKEKEEIQQEGAALPIRVVAHKI